MNELVIGIDGGGTHCRARLANTRGETLGMGEAGAANPHAAGYAAAQHEILGAIQRAFDDAKIEKQIVTAACMGIGGIDRPDERAQFAEWAQQFIASRAFIVNDGEIVLAAGLPENWGIALIAGTGSIAWGRTRDGKIARAGGWGYLIGDEGSGFDLAREALRAATHYADGRGEPTHLLDAILAHWHLDDARRLIPHVYRSGLKPADFAELAPLVIRASETGDAVARRLVERASESLAETIITVAKILPFHDGKIPLALAGGLLLQAAPLRLNLMAELKRRKNRFAPVTLVAEPVVGAVRLAINLAHSK